MPDEPKQYRNREHVDVDTHVAALDTEVKGLGREMGQVREQLGSLGASVSNGFAELHRLIANRNQVNWAVVIGAGMLLLAAIGYLQVSTVRPLQVIDDSYGLRIQKLEDRQWQIHELTVRLDERSKLSNPFGK